MPTKKVLTKPKVQPTKAKRIAPALIEAQGDHRFWVHDGAVLKNLSELEVALKTMKKGVFTHHVTKEKNDFASWVEFVLLDEQCALALRKAKTAKSAHEAVKTRLSSYRKK